MAQIKVDLWVNTLQVGTAKHEPASCKLLETIITEALQKQGLTGAMTTRVLQSGVALFIGPTPDRED